MFSWFQRWQRLCWVLTCFWGEVFRKCFSRIDMTFFVLCFPCFWIFRWHQTLSFLCCFLTGGRGKIRKDRADLAFAIWSYSLRCVWLDFHEWVATHLYIIIPFSSPSLALRLLRWLQVCAYPYHSQIPDEKLTSDALHASAVGQGERGSQLRHGTPWECALLSCMPWWKSWPVCSAEENLWLLSLIRR